MTRAARVDNRWLILLLALAALALGWNLGGGRLLDPDEGRNAEVAREMATTHDYVVPHLDGLPYLDKPVLYFAAAAAAMQLLGPHELAARLPAYLATLATIALVVWFARRRFGAAAGWLAGVALATMPMVLAYARTTIFDSTLSFCTTAAVIAFAEDHAVLAWAAIGAGGLTKGPIAILIPLAVVVPHAVLTGRPLRSLVPWRGLLVFAVVAFPWFLAVTARIPEFPYYAFVRETFQRFTTTSFHRTAPFWYYFPIIPVAAFPWIVPALSRLGGGRVRWTWEARRVNPLAQDALLLGCWMLGPLVFFTLNQSKLPQYVLPLMPAFALAAARHLSREPPATGWKVYVGSAVVLAAGLLFLPVLLPTKIPLTAAERASIPGVGVALAVVLVSAAVVVGFGAWRRQRTLVAAGYAAAVIALPLVTAPLMRAVGEDRSAAALADSVRGKGVVLAIAVYPPSLPFYLGNQIPVATANARELTSNFIADYAETYRAVPGSPLLPADAWRARFATCAEPTIFLTRAGDRAVRAELATLPLLFLDTHYAAYGPCSAGAPTHNSAFRIPHSAIREGGVGR
ncbi:MAG TPA: glycosyltransferase family 39 protein [Gemmatimonadales bacterium]|nr:glycosyltransferase family 39 protein [Gemmatimonadales bacterium]